MDSNYLLRILIHPLWIQKKWKTNELEDSVGLKYSNIMVMSQKLIPWLIHSNITCNIVERTNQWFNINVDPWYLRTTKSSLLNIELLQEKRCHGILWYMIKVLFFFFLFMYIYLLDIQFVNLILCLTIF